MFWFKTVQFPLTLPLKLTLLLFSFSLGLNRSGSLLNPPIPLVQKPNVAGVLGIAKGKEKQIPEQQGNKDVNLWPMNRCMWHMFLYTDLYYTDLCFVQ